MPTICTLLLCVVLGAPPSERVESERLMETIEALPEKRSPNGSREHQEGLRETERYLAERLRALGYEPDLLPIEWAVPFRGRDGREMPPQIWNNIVVDIPGRERPEEILIVGAHFDAVAISPGADDNGTGTAALLELAQVLRDEPMERTVRLMFFNLEEMGLVGSREYVDDVRDQILDGSMNIVGMVSLDGIGYFSDEAGSQRSPIKRIPGVFEPPTTGDFILLGGVGEHREFSQAFAGAMRASAPALRVFTADFFPVAPPDLLRSDHAPFLMAGVPSILLADTANFRNPHYHRATDTPDTIDVERYTLVVRGVAGAVRELADAQSEKSEEPAGP